MSDDDPKKPYTVGYGRPPAAHRFKKGQSGNPKGRPKGLCNFTTDLREVLRLPVPYETPTGPKKVSSQKAALLRLRERALKGDLRALQQLINLAILLDGRPGEPEAFEAFSPDDAAILDRFVKQKLAERDAAHNVGGVDRDDPVKGSGDPEEKP